MATVSTHCRRRMSSRSPHVSGPSSTTATELNRAQAATATASPARGAHPHRHSCWVTLTPARTSPSSLPLPSPWWRCAGQHPLEHRGASTRRIGGDPARGGVVSRSVPGGGVFSFFRWGASVGNRNAVLRKYPPLKIPEEPPVPLVLPGSSQAR